jgi:hypothetical protein
VRGKKVNGSFQGQFQIDSAMRILLGQHDEAGRNQGGDKKKPRRSSNAGLGSVLEGLTL